MDLIGLLAKLDPNQVALGTIVTLVIFSIIKGWLVPSGSVKERMGDKEKQITALETERDDWKAAFMKSEEARTIINRQNGELLDSSKVTNHLIESLRNVIERMNGKGGSQ